MHSGDITIENISKIEGSAGLKVTVVDDKVTDLKFMIRDYRRFYTKAVKGKPIISVPAFLSRICGTCSVSPCSEYRRSCPSVPLLPERIAKATPLSGSSPAPSP